LIRQFQTEISAAQIEHCHLSISVVIFKALKSLLSVHWISLGSKKFPKVTLQVETKKR